MTGLLVRFRLRRMAVRSASASQRYYRLAEWRAIGARPEEGQPAYLRKHCEAVRLAFGRERAFLLYSESGDPSYLPEAVDHLATLVAFLRGGAGQGWNEEAVQAIVLDQAMRLLRDPRAFAKEHRELTDQVHRAMEEFFVRDCLDRLEE